MIVTLIQMDIKWGDIAANCDTASLMIDSQPGSDLYILPEMWSTGFATDPESIADDSLLSLTWMQQKANETNAAIAGSVATKCEDGTYRNRFYFVVPQTDKANQQTPPLGGGGAFYDKHHLFRYGNEHLRYTAGNDRIIVEWRGVRFLLQICYDLRFPSFSRNIPRPTDKVYKLSEDKSILQDSQKQPSLLGRGWGRGWGWGAIIYVASWPTSRISVWHTLLKARAIENQCYVLAVDRIGTDPACEYCGGTEIIDAYGRVVEACPDNEACTITTELNMDKLAAFRKKFPVLNDAD